MLYSYDQIISPDFDKNLLSNYSEEDNLILAREIIKISASIVESQYLVSINRYNYNNSLFLQQSPTKRYGYQAPTSLQIQFNSIEELLSKFDLILNHVGVDNFIFYDPDFDKKMTHIDLDIVANLVFTKKFLDAIKFSVKKFSSNAVTGNHTHNKQSMLNQMNYIIGIKRAVQTDGFDPDSLIPGYMKNFGNLNDKELNNDISAKEYLSISISNFFEKKLDIDIFKEQYIEDINTEFLFNILSRSTEDYYSLVAKEKSLQIFLSKLKKINIKNEAVLIKIYETYLLYNGKNIDSLKKFDEFYKNGGRSFEKEREKKYSEVLGYKESLDQMIKSRDADVRCIAASILEKNDPRFEKLINDRSRSVFNIVLRKIDVDKLALMFGSKKINSPYARKIIESRMEK